MLTSTTYSATETPLHSVVSGICQGQQWAQVALYDRFFTPAYHTAYRIVKNKMAAEDAVHEGFIKAFKKMSSLKNPEVVEGWLKRIVMHEALQSIKADKYYGDPSQREVVAEEEETNVATVPLAELHSCIEQLPEGYRIICQLHWIEGMKHDEIAEVVGISASTSRSQLARAKTKLRDIISQKGLLK